MIEAIKKGGIEVHEVWKDIAGYEGVYQVSNKGRVKSLQRTIERSNGWKYTVRERILRQCELKFKGDKKSRKIVHLKSVENKWFLVHRLVSEAFIPNPSNLPQVNHKDGNPFNNNVENLEWTTNHDNVVHAYENGLMRTEKRVVKICPLTRESLGVYKSGSEASRQHKVTPGAIFHAINNGWKAGGFYWKYDSRKVCKSTL